MLPKLLDKSALCMSTGMKADVIPEKLWGITLGSVFQAVYSPVMPSVEMVRRIGVIVYPTDEPIGRSKLEAHYGVNHPAIRKARPSGVLPCNPWSVNR